MPMLIRSITADTDDQIDIKVAGSDKVQINATGLGIGQVPTRDLSLHAGDASASVVAGHFTGQIQVRSSWLMAHLLIGLGSSEDLVLNNQESSNDNIIFENGWIRSDCVLLLLENLVGINTSSPDAPLHVFGENANGTDLATSLRCKRNRCVFAIIVRYVCLTTNVGYTVELLVLANTSNGAGTTA